MIRQTTNPIVIQLIGKSGRLAAIAAACTRSRHKVEVHIFSEVDNPGFRKYAHDVVLGRTDDRAEVTKAAQKLHPDFAIIEPEEPLAAGVADALNSLNIPVVGPTQKLSQLESSKSFTRNLLEQHQIDGNIIYRTFSTDNGLASYARTLSEFVVKPDGLTGGKGVRVQGDHFTTHKEGIDIARELIALGSSVVIEEKLDGEEFSFQSFTDGNCLAHMVPVQDHKRAFDGDRGPNTGGMGSYSCEDHLLPFLEPKHIEQAKAINTSVLYALCEDIGERYKGILYGSFMLTKHGLKVIEYNARFGDPEAMNVLPILRTDFVDICLAILEGRLSELDVSFERKATVCKYVVPQGYPTSLVAGAELDLTAVVDNPNLESYFAAAKSNRAGKVELTNSRAIAFVGIGDTLSQAEMIAERAASQVRGPVYHRRDIGTAALIRKRVEHMQRITQERPMAAADARRAV